MGIATSIFKQLAFKVESAYGTAPGASGAQLLRRVESTLDLVKETYQSNEKATHQQVADLRHGVRRVQGNVRGELSPLTYEAWFAALLRKAWAATTAMTGLSVTIAAGSVVNGVQTYTLTRASGNFLTDGLRIGDVGRLTAGSFNAANLNKNLLVIGLTATVATVITLNGSALVAEGPIASATLSVPGKKSLVPASGHTDLSFSVEHWFPEVPTRELFLGCKPVQCALALPPTGLATVDWTLQGQDVQTDAARYFSSPTDVTSTGLTAAVNGLLIAAGAPIGIVTGLNATIAGNFSGEPVVGRNTVPNVFPGRVTASGELTAYFDSAALRDAYINETELALTTVLTVDNSAAAAFFALTFPRIKLGSATKDDPEGGIQQTIAFTAVKRGGATDADNTTVVVQDSAVP